MSTLYISYLNNSNEPLLQEAFKFNIHRELAPHHEETLKRCFAKNSDAIIRDNENVWVIAHKWHYGEDVYYSHYEILEAE